LFLSDLYPDRKVPDAKGNGTTATNGSGVTGSTTASLFAKTGLGVRNGTNELSSQQLLGSQASRVL